MEEHAFDVTNDWALTAAINVLRDSIESGRMPSGQVISSEVVELHRQAAERLELIRDQLQHRR